MAGQRQGQRKTIFAAILLTAAVALLSPVAFLSAWVHAESLPTMVYSTALGEYRQVHPGELLAVRMNTNTAFTMRNSPELGEVRLDHGEALFDLQRGSARPLQVLAGRAVVSTRAASFSVRVRDARSVDVLVASGQVTVGTATMRENQLARVSAAGTVLRDLDEAEVRRVLEWTSGHITFSGETLAEATAEFNRYNSRKLVIADRTISSLAIGGKFRTTDVESFVAALRPIGIRREKSDEPFDNNKSIRLVSSQRD